ncbi:MAG: carboxy terminal-processing peptidase [Steroidobacteraceae bacterium]|nr:carboxy terminal-processing peptidase [Nevskiaceae bacterium]MCP5467102.1 carboxy terminal-processing peptidase [Nevskiaceae bacterium]
MYKASRPSATWLAVSALCVALLALGSSSSATSGPAMLPPGALAPTDRQRMIARQVGSILEEAHFRRATIDDRFSAEVFTKFLDFMDGQRSYFLASDIAEFEPLRLRFDDMIRSGDIDPAYGIFARFQQRNRERIRYALAQLEKEPDWTVDESFEFDRSKAPWPQTSAELDELWRKRIKNDAVSLLLTGKDWAEATDVLRKRYERVLKRGEQVSPDDVFENLMNAYARTFDPHSSYFSPRNSEEYRIQMSLNYEGIGASLQLVDDYVTVMNVIEGGPAAAAGTLTVKDRITAVGQGKEGPLTDVIGWRIDDVVQLIRGKGGTTVRLQILPAGAAPGTTEKVLDYVRGKVTLEAQAARKEIKTIKRGDQELKVGVINVPGFYSDYEAQRAGNANYRSTTRDVRRLIDELRKETIDGLVLDLRGNGGGFLPEAQSLTGLFIDRGPVVQVKFSTGEKEVLDDPDAGLAYAGPLAVLVDRFSASASEIFAGAIQDYRRGVVLGQRTFGKGTVQNLVPLSRYTSRPVNGQLTVTIGKFYRVTGESTQHRGVEPDVTLASPISLEDVGESALDDALPWDRIAGVPFRTDDSSAPASIASLALEESNRAKNDPDYRWLVSDIAALESMRQQKSVSLNLQTRREERARLEAQRLERENTRRVSQQQTPLKSVEEIDAAATPDVVLDQAAEVMADMVLSAGTADRALPAISAGAPRSN